LKLFKVIKFWSENLNIRDRIMQLAGWYLLRQNYNLWWHPLTIYQSF